jgi:ABC-type transport system involved in multi-copper enzyme maturation permease subunit
MKMGPLGALLKKELTEILGDRSSRRGGFIQGVIIIAVLGGVFPASVPAVWVAGSVKALLYFGLLPGVPAAVLAADAIAGERERRTLPTLLASPIRESTLLFGKWLAAVAYGGAIALLALVLALIVVTWTVGAFAPSPVLVIGALAAGLASAALMASVTVIVSMMVSAARAAQQIASVLSMLLILGGARLAVALGLVPTWPLLFATAGTAIAIAFAVLIVGQSLFRRERLVSDR